MAKAAPKKRNPADVTQYALRKIRREIKELEKRMQYLDATIDRLATLIVGG